MKPPAENNTNSSNSNSSATNTLTKGNTTKSNPVQIPEISLPKGGGAIKGIEEKFQVNSVTGTSSFSIPIPLSPSRHGFVPAIGLSYNSGSGNSHFGLGWDVGISAIARKMQKQLPLYRDKEESDTFILPRTEDLVLHLEKKNGSWVKYSKPRTENGNTYTVTRYRPRIEGLFARIEKWKNYSNGDIHWRTITGDDIHSYYGLTPESRISDPQDGSKVSEWLLYRIHDDKGNITFYRYKKED